MTETTPKIIHYCWFGKAPKPDSMLKYIGSWHRLIPDYKIIEWNEDNFDVNCCEYVRQAYAAKKYAFVSDYARLYALYNHGGVYLDTDVEVIAPLGDLLTDHVIVGFEEFNYVATSTIISPKNSTFIKAFMDSYAIREFYKADGNLDQTTNVRKLTSMLEGIGLIRDGKEQCLDYLGEKIIVLDQRKLSPMDYPNNINKSDDTTYTVHYYGQSWASNSNKFKRSIKHLLIRLFGHHGLKWTRDVITRLRGFINPSGQQ